jgi:hypothetical protein
MLRRDAFLRGPTMGELRKFLGENKVWWITPIVIVFLFVSYMTFLAATSGDGIEDDSPFVYDVY